MKNIINYNIFLKERLEQEYFEKNPDFYLSSTNVEKISNIKREKDLNDFLSNITVDNFNKIVRKIGTTLLVFKGLNFFYFYVHKCKKNFFILSPDISQNEYSWKFIIGVMSKMKLDAYEFQSYDNFKHAINPVFNIINDYYGLYYKKKYDDFNLFLTKDKNEYIEKIRYCKSKSFRIIYYNSKMSNGKEFFDIENLNISKTKYFLKNLSYNDIYFKRFKDDFVYYDVKLRSEKLKNFKLGISFKLASESQMENLLFGLKIGHRYHMEGGLRNEFKGVGLGYKIYKAFIKHIGYITSNDQTTEDVRNVYFRLLKDPDFYSIVEYPGKIIIIDKQYKKIKNLLKLVKEYEIENNVQLKYDDELLEYMNRKK